MGSARNQGNTLHNSHNNIKHLDVTNQAHERPVWQEFQVSEKRNWGKYQKMKRPPMLMDQHSDPGLT